MGFHGGKGQERGPQRGKLGRRIAPGCFEPPRDKQPKAEQSAEEKAEHQEEILGQRPGQRGGKKPQPDGAGRFAALLQSLPQHDMAIEKCDAFQHHQAVHPGKDRHALHAHAEQPASCRAPGGPEPPSQPTSRQVQQHAAR